MPNNAVGWSLRMDRVRLWLWLGVCVCVLVSGSASNNANRRLLSVDSEAAKIQLPSRRRTQTRRTQHTYFKGKSTFEFEVNDLPALYLRIFNGIFSLCRTSPTPSHSRLPLRMSHKQAERSFSPLQLSSTSKRERLYLRSILVRLAKC